MVPLQVPVAEVRQIGLLECLRRVQLDHRRSPVGEQRVDSEGQIRRAHHLVENHADELRQPLAAVVGRHRDPGPAGIDEGPVGLPVAGRRAHHAVLVVAALLVRPGRFSGSSVFSQSLAPSSINRVDHVGRRVLVARQRGNLAHVEELVEHEAHVAESGAL